MLLLLTDRIEALEENIQILEDMCKDKATKIAALKAELKEEEKKVLVRLETKLVWFLYSCSLSRQAKYREERNRTLLSSFDELLQKGSPVAWVHTQIAKNCEVLQLQKNCISAIHLFTSIELVVEPV